MGKSPVKVIKWVRGNAIWDGLKKLWESHDWVLAMLIAVAGWLGNRCRQLSESYGQLHWVDKIGAVVFCVLVVGGLAIFVGIVVERLRRKRSSASVGEISSIVTVAKTWGVGSRQESAVPATYLIALQCSDLLKRYRALHEEHKVDFPLRIDTPVGDPWNASQVKLLMLKDQLLGMLAGANEVWKRAGWPKDEVFVIHPEMSVGDLLFAIERFQNLALSYNIKG